MEELLSPREFIKRFHLPQLVRISRQAGPPSELVPVVAQQASGANAQRAPPSKREQRDPGWTYSSGGGGGGGRLEDEDEASGSKSLHFADPRTGVREMHRSACEGPVSLNAASARLLPRVKLSRMATNESYETTSRGATLRPPLNDLTFSRRGLSRGSWEKSDKKQQDAASAASIKLMPPSKRPTLSKLELEQPFLIYKAHRKLEVCAYAADSNNELHDKSGDPIYFPHNYQGWFSIEPPAKPPRAGDKSAQKSPSCDARRSQQQQQQHLNSLDQVCQASGHVFLTRDELPAYELPSKLSHLTRLKNHQLLAVPLAIQLGSGLAATGASGSFVSGTSGGDKKSSSPPKKESSKSRKSSKESGAKSSINDLRPCVIGAGRVLRICGIYEDVLPLLESSGKRAGDSKQQDLSTGGQRAPPTHWPHPGYVTSPEPSPCHYYGMAPQGLVHPSVMMQQQASSPAVAAQNMAAYAPIYHPSQPRRDQRILRQQQQQQLYGVAVPPAPPGGQNGNYGRQQQQQPFTSVSPAAQAVQAAPSAGRRYARCVLLSDDALDQLTGCAPPGGGSKLPNSNGTMEAAQNQLTKETQETEVLIPLNLAGRFYLCATSQTIANELNCHDCSLAAHRAAPYLVFRLSQIVYLLNVNKRLSLASGGGNQHPPHQPSHQWRPFSSVFALPLQVRLVTGSRPASFSPAMFGLSSTMESYFAQEAHVGGHALACKFNLSLQRAAEGGTGSAPDGTQAQVSGPGVPNSTPVCACAHSLRASSGDGGEALGWFAGALRLESLAKRDVLLACTIKQRPLVHSELTTSRLSGGGTARALSSAHLNGLQTAAKAPKSLRARRAGAAATLSAASGGRVGLAASAAKSSMRLDELDDSLLFLDKSQAQVAPKSSMSRLRACRSLISLNGRRQKKKRPDIPSSMLMGDRQPASLLASPLDGASGASKLSDEMGRRQLLLLQEDHTAAANSDLLMNLRLDEPQIVLIEIDCGPGGVGGTQDHTQDDQGPNQIKLARTFVERSLPAASIPDLVVTRMDYCRANSQLWERQLKLSHASLSRDFDSCQRQLAGLDLAAAAGSHHQMALQQRDAPELQAAQGPMSLLYLERSAGCALEEDPKHDQQLQQQRDLTGSSRSSSGVSSAGEHRARFARQVAAANKRATSSSSSLSASVASQHSAAAAASPSSSCEVPAQLEPEQVVVGSSKSRGSGGRLLRLVQKILPAAGPARSTVANLSHQVAPPSAAVARRAQQQHSSTGGSDCSSSSGATLSSGTAAAANKAHQQLRLMEELNGRFRSKLSLGAGADAHRQQQTQGAKIHSTSTLMNAQKVHRRLLLTGSMRHLPSELLERMLAEEVAADEMDCAHGDGDSKSCRGDREEECEDFQAEDDDDSSHLYESLERLSESLQSAGLTAAAAHQELHSQAHKQQQALAASQRQQHSSRMLAKIQLIKQQQAARRRQRLLRATTESSPGATGAAPAHTSRPPPPAGLGARLDFGDDQADEWWRGASSDDERGAQAQPQTRARATSGCAPPATVATAAAAAQSWRQRLVASVGAVGQQRKPPPSGKNRGLSHSMELSVAGESYRAAAAPAATATTSPADELLDMEPVSIEACEGRRAASCSSGSLTESASDSDSSAQQALGDAPRRKDRDRGHHRRDNDDSPPSSSFGSSISHSSSAPCSVASDAADPSACDAATSRDIETTSGSGGDKSCRHPAAEDIYVNLASGGASSWSASSLDLQQQQQQQLEIVASPYSDAEEGGGGARDDEAPETASNALKLSQRNLRLVGRMERKLAKLRGRRRDSAAARLLVSATAAQGDYHQQQHRESHSLGWAPADELRRANEPQQQQQQPGTANAMDCSHSSRASSESSSSSSSSSGCDSATERQQPGEGCRRLADKALLATTRKPVTNGNADGGACQQQQQQQPHNARAIVTLDRPATVATAAMANHHEEHDDWTSAS